jgi:hypothetical protein
MDLKMQQQVVVAILTTHYQDRTTGMLFNQDSVRPLVGKLHPHYRARLKDFTGIKQPELAHSVVLVTPAQVV